MGGKVSVINKISFVVMVLATHNSFALNRNQLSVQERIERAIHAVGIFDDLETLQQIKSRLEVWKRLNNSLELEFSIKNVIYKIDYIKLFSGPAIVSQPKPVIITSRDQNQTSKDAGSICSCQ
jgi:hypothetical protein